MVPPRLLHSGVRGVRPSRDPPLPAFCLRDAPRGGTRNAATATAGSAELSRSLESQPRPCSWNLEPRIGKRRSCVTATVPPSMPWSRVRSHGAHRLQIYSYRYHRRVKLYVRVHVTAMPEGFRRTERAHLGQGQGREPQKLLVSCPGLCPTEGQAMLPPGTSTQ